MAGMEVHLVDWPIREGGHGQGIIRQGAPGIGHEAIGVIDGLRPGEGLRTLEQDGAGTKKRLDVVADRA